MLLYLLSILLALIYWLITRKYDYWEKRNVPYIKPTFLLGNFGSWILRKKTIGQNVQDLCKKMPNERYFGAFLATEPILIVVDLELIKLVMNKDFYFFHGREITQHNHKDGSSYSLLAASGDNWKVLRKNLTPLFSSAKMKNMFHLIEKCSREFETMLDREYKINKKQEVKGIMANFTMECISECAFGVHANTMGEDIEQNPFKKLSKSFSSHPPLNFYKRLFRVVWPSIYFLFVYSQLFKNHMIFFKNVITSVMSNRNYKPSGRNDFVDLVVTWKQNKKIYGNSVKSFKTGDNKKVSVEVNDSLLVSQCFTFFSAGFETSSTIASYTLYELAKRKDIQERVFDEIDKYLARNNYKLNFECLIEFPYLEACINETLRLYPVLGTLPREVMEDYTLDKGLKLEKGLRINLPVQYLHYNPQYFDDPEEYKPERFYGEEKKNIPPYSYLPFGEGPRMCIGMRFAKMQMIAGLITVLKEYTLELAEGMPTKLSLVPESLLPQAIGGINLKFTKRHGWEKRVFAKH